MKKTVLALFLIFFFVEILTAQKVIAYKNVANYVHNNRTDWTVGFRLRNKNYLTIGLENWHFKRTLFPMSNSFADDTKIVSFGRRLNLGILHIYNKRQRKWHLYDHFFLQAGYQFHETTQIFNFGSFPSSTTSTFFASNKMTCGGIGIENGFVYNHKKWFLGPAITTGYVLYFEDGEFVPAFDLVQLNKGMYIWLPMVRFVVGYKF